MSNVPEQPRQQSKLGCLALILFLPGVIITGYAIVRLIYWLTGEPMPKF